MSNAIPIEGLYMQEVTFVNEQHQIEKCRLVAPTGQDAMRTVRRERPRVIITGARRIMNANDEFSKS